MGGGGDGCLFEAGRLLTFSAFRMGAYSRWALIRVWVLIRINTVLNSDRCKEHRISFVKDEPQFAPVGNEPERVTSAKLLGLTIVN